VFEGKARRRKCASGNDSPAAAQDARTETGERMSFGLWRQLDEMPLRRTSLDNNVWKWQTRL